MSDLDLSGMITTSQAVEIAAQNGREYTLRYISYVARKGKIPGCVKVGGKVWLIPREEFIKWVKEDRRPGPKTD